MSSTQQPVNSASLQDASYKILPTKSSTPVVLSDPAVLVSFQTEIEVSQHPGLSQHSCKMRQSRVLTLSPQFRNYHCLSDQGASALSLRQNSCKTLCISSFHFTARQLECGDADRTITNTSCLFTNFIFSAAESLRTSSQNPPAQADNGRQAHLVHYLFESLRRPSQHDCPACHPCPAGRQGECLPRARHLYCIQ
jgi:hypothetical protein